MPRFLLEDYFADFKAMTTWNIGSSDVEPLTLTEALGSASKELSDLWRNASLAYGPNRGLPQLRAAIAGRYATLTPEYIHVTNGATEAIFAVVNTLVAEGDHVVVVGPTYQLLVDAPKAAGANVTQIDLRFEEGWNLDVGRVQAAVTPRTKLIIVNFPNNPTGKTLTGAELNQLVEIADEAGAWLLCDEIYRGLGTVGSEAEISAGADLGAHVISIGSVSKVYGLAGARIGWVAATDSQVLDRVRTFRYWSTLGTSVLGELLALSALERHAELIKRARDIVAINRAALSDVITDHPDLLAWRPQNGGTTALVEVRQGRAANFAAWLAHAHGVLTVPSAVLPFPGEFLRIGLGRKAGTEGLRRLSTALDDTTTLVKTR